MGKRFSPSHPGLTIPVGGSSFTESACVCVCVCARPPAHPRDCAKAGTLYPLCPVVLTPVNQTVKRPLDRQEN